MPKSNRPGKNAISFHYSHTVKKTDGKLSVSYGSANALSTYNMKNIFLLTDVGRGGRGALPSWIFKFDIFVLHF